MKVIDDKININKEDQNMNFNNTLVVGEYNNIIKKSITAIKKIKDGIVFYSFYFMLMYFFSYLLLTMVLEPTLNNVILKNASVQNAPSHILAIYLSIGTVFAVSFEEVQYDYSNVLIITDRKISKLSSPERRNEENYEVDTEIKIDELENLEIGEDSIKFEETSGKMISIPNRDGIFQQIQNKLYNM